MSWKKVGQFLQKNASKGVGLVGALLTGNVPGAISAGAALVSSATGTVEPDEALKVLESDPNSLLRLKELQLENDKDIRRHLERITELKLNDNQVEHRETQATIRNGDNSDDPWVRRVRPAHATIALIAAVAYAFTKSNPDVYVLGLLLTLPFTYAGLRQIDKGLTVFNERKAIEAQAKR